jgi:hypothetical protein
MQIVLSIKASATICIVAKKIQKDVSNNSAETEML